MYIVQFGQSVRNISSTFNAKRKRTWMKPFLSHKSSYSINLFKLLMSFFFSREEVAHSAAFFCVDFLTHFSVLEARETNQNFLETNDPLLFLNYPYNFSMWKFSSFFIFYTIFYKWKVGFSPRKGRKGAACPKLHFLFEKAPFSSSVPDS